MEKEFYRVMVDGNGRTFIVDDAGNKLPPETAIHISQSLSDTANEICYLYLMYRPEKDDYKIGISIEPDRRLGQLNGIEPHELLHTYPMKAHGENCAAEIELKLHKIYKAVGQHVEGEYFKLDDFDILILGSNVELITQWTNAVYKTIIISHVHDHLSIVAQEITVRTIAVDVSKNLPKLILDYMRVKAIHHKYCHSEDRIFEANTLLEILWGWFEDHLIEKEDK